MRRAEAGDMTSNHLRQRRPDRRFRRLLPAAVAAVTLATSAPFVVPAVSHANDNVPRREQHRDARPQPPGKIPAILHTETDPGVRVQGVSTT